MSTPPPRQMKPPSRPKSLAQVVQARSGAKTRGIDYRHQHQHDKQRYEREGPSEEEIAFLEDRIAAGRDYTQRDVSSLRPTSAEELRGVLGDKYITQRAQRPNSMEFSPPEWEAFVAERKLRNAPQDKSTFAGLLKNTFTTPDGDIKPIEDLWSQVFSEDEPDFKKEQSAYHGIKNIYQQSELSRQYQDYQQYRRKKDKNKDDYERDVEALRKKFPPEDLDHRLRTLDRLNKEITSEDQGAYEPIPEIENLNEVDFLDNGSGPYLQPKPIPTFRNSQVYRLVPLVRNIFDLINPDVFDSADEPPTKIVTLAQERRDIRDSAQRIRDSVKEMTPDTLNEMFLHTQESFHDEDERIRRMDLFFRQQHALLEELTDQGVLDVPLFSDKSRVDAAEKLTRHFNRHIIPQMIYSQSSPTLTNIITPFIGNSVQIPSTHSQLGMQNEAKNVKLAAQDTFFSSTLPADQSIQYRLGQISTNQQHSLFSFGENISRDDLVKSLEKTHRQSVQDYINNSVTTQDSNSSGGFFSKITSLFFPPPPLPPTSQQKDLTPTFLSTAHLNNDSPPQESQSWFSRAFSQFLPDGHIGKKAELIDHIDIELAHDYLQKESKAHRDVLFGLKSDPYGKSSRELAAEHMKALNEGSYFNTNTPKGKLLGQIEQLQELLRNPQIPPQIKGQLKIYQQQAFLAYYQIEKDEKEGKFDPGYIQNEQNKNLLKKIQTQKLQKEKDELFVTNQRKTGYNGVPEADFALKRSQQRNDERAHISSIGIGQNSDGNNPFRPIYNYSPPPLHPIKKPFDLHNPIMKTPLDLPTKPFHPCNEWEDQFRHCFMDNGNNVVPCRKEFKVFKQCKSDHPVQQIDPNLEQLMYQYPARQNSYVDKFTLDTTFGLD